MKTACMTLTERSGLVLAFAKVLYVNGQSTDQTLAAAGQLAGALGLNVSIMPRWGELLLQAEDGNARLLTATPAEPSGVNMDRVAAAMRALQEVSTGRLASTALMAVISTIARAPPAPAWMFTLAAGAGAVALAVLFGVQHAPAAALIFVSVAAGAIVRRGVARHSANIFLQPFCAALLAGIIGALAVRYELSSSLRLVAVCPCMILVPGPHVLNGALDIVKGRMHLGAARLLCACCLILAISLGLLLGLALFGVTLPVDQPATGVPLWQDMIAAGVAVAAYGVFFSMPPAMLGWPVAAGMLAHALRWGALVEFGASAATGALVACLTVGVILTPVARRWHMPFAAIGFASVVSMIPGVFLFRMASGLLRLADGSDTTPLLLSSTVADGSTAMCIILAMSFGLIVPKLVIDRIGESRGERSPETAPSLDIHAPEITAAVTPRTLQQRPPPPPS
jgi:uncharacterized membrane protein YjjP (DUF1212 family)